MMSFTDGDARNGPGRWYELFSRGTRDWLRHNEKVRQAVRDHLPELVAGSDVLSDARDRTVKVPVRFMEHYRFRLRDQDEQQGAGQGDAKPGDVLRPARPVSGSDPAGGEGEGQVSFVLEFQIDDILDWLWEDLQLPNLKPREGSSVEEDAYVREGWDKRGARSRLDRRRTMREAVKRRGAQPDSRVPIGNDDLRFRQLARRRKPTTNAVVFFVLDVSSSMDEHCRRLAKTFFFWALQGIRRQYTSVETVFVAHTVGAWEFDEEQFFQVRGEGGTKSSTGFAKAREILDERYDPARYNCYLFYATDGHNFSEDRAAASEAVRRLLADMNFAGYAEVSQQAHRHMDTEVAAIWQRLAADDLPVGSYTLTSDSDIWPAIKAFFTDQAERSGVA
jgi:sporulation protein YhbH